MKKNHLSFLTPLLAGGFVSTGLAAIVTSTGSDGFNLSSFNSGGIWGGSAPSAGNDYVVAAGHRIRTPNSAASFSFAGDSLTINSIGTGADTNLLGFTYKGTGTTGIITVPNLILDGGAVNHLNGPADIFRLAGAINVAGDSIIYAKQGPIEVSADISGSATITNPGADGAGRTLTFLSTGSTFDGNLVNNGNFVLANNAVFNFTIGSVGVNNTISGTGSTFLDGVFVFDLSSASSTLGDSWTLTSNVSYGSNFNVSGFTDNLDNTWSSGVYLFDETSGVLSVIPEPSAALLSLLGLLGLACRRRA